MEIRLVPRFTIDVRLRSQGLAAGGPVRKRDDS
jgi:hypothetical protein